MFLTEETYRDAMLAAIHSQGVVEDIAPVIEKTVDALIAADRKLKAYEKEALELTSGTQKPALDIA